MLDSVAESVESVAELVESVAEPVEAPLPCREAGLRRQNFPQAALTQGRKPTEWP